MAQYLVHSSRELQAACDVVQAGDVILVHGGRYDRRSRLCNRQGPIVFTAADDGWISGGRSPDPFRGEKPPAEDAPSKPSLRDFAFLQIVGCEHIVIDGLKIEKCWPSILFVRDTRHLQVRNCIWRHGTHAIFAQREGTSHILVENNEWQQDDSPEHDLWLKFDWARAHGDEGSDGLLRYFNGGFFSSKGIAGKVVIRDNRIMDAYNGIRMKAKSASPRQSPPLNADVHIYANQFIRIRDNPVEPEVFAYNWHVRHNRLLDCHAWFSFDGVTGGYWYFYGNTAYFHSRQGPCGSHDGHTMGRVLKLSYEKRPRDAETEGVPAFPWFVFNNSWHLRCPLIGGANPAVPANGEGPDFTAHLDFFNNAFDWCNPLDDGAWLCEWVELLRNFDLVRTLDSRFDYDICDLPNFFSVLAEAGHGEAHGLRASRPIFNGSSVGDFTLAADSQALGSGWIRGVERPTGAPAGLRLQEDGSLNRGAVQDYRLIEVPDLEAEAETVAVEIASAWRELSSLQ